jgi:very-short-patch-repair endonuclease
MAAVLAAGDGAVLSHRSAGVLWGLLDRQRESGPIEVIVPGGCDIQGVLGHRNGLQVSEATRLYDIPVTTAERTLLDLAQTIPATELGRLCDDALRRRIATLGRLHALAKAHAGGGRRRLEPIQQVLADRIVGYDPGANEWELRMDRMWDGLHLPEAQRQYRIRVGRRTYRVDRAIVELQIAVEWNGYDPHGYRSNVDDDADRRAELAAAGWYCMAFTSKSSPRLICRSVLAVVEERRLMLRAAG